MADQTPPPDSPNIVPPGVTNAEINIANEPPSSPMLTDDAHVANLFGSSDAIAQNKRMSILREASGHTPARKKRGDTAHRASSLRARIAIQETLAADMMSTLHIGDSSFFVDRDASSDLIRAPGCYTRRRRRW